jgi:hypothetical protein
MQGTKNDQSVLADWSLCVESIHGSFKATTKQNKIGHDDNNANETENIIESNNQPQMQLHSHQKQQQMSLFGTLWLVVVCIPKVTVKRRFRSIVVVNIQSQHNSLYKYKYRYWY